MKVVFYTTDGCSLCEQVLDGLFGEPGFAGVELVTSDIALDDELVDRYASTLPVLKASDVELHSPFTTAEAVEWLAKATVAS